MGKLISFLVMSCLLFQSVNAQSAVPSIEKQTGVDSTKVYFLDQITVSATRFPEHIMEIPYAVTVLNKGQMRISKGYGLDELLNSVPGVLAQSRYGNQDIRLTIRGFGARGAGDRSNSGTSRGIKIILDGISETEPDGRTSFDNIDPNLAQTVEIIRSNASALWGNASGGVVNISTIPSFNNSFVQTQGILGSYGLKKTLFHAGTALNNGKIYASFSNASFDGWRKHSGSNRALLNIGLLSNLHTNSVLGVYLVGSSSSFHIPGPLSQTQFDSDPKQANSTYEARDERRFNRTGRIGVTLEHAFNSSNSISALAYLNPKYLQRSERGTFRDFTRYHTGGNFIYRNKSQLGNVLQNNLTLGADEAYQDGAILFYNLSPSNGRGNILRDNKSEGANSFGAFIQDEIKFMDYLSLIIGGRYDNVTYFNENYLSAENSSERKSFEQFTPKAGLVYRITPLYSLYANLGGGIEVPAGNETDPAGTFGQDSVYLINPLLEPIRPTTLEIGTKHILPFERKFLNSASYDLALYYITIKNDIIPYRGGRFFFTAGQTYRAGIELSTLLNLTNSFSIQGGLSYSINKYDEYKIDSVHYDLNKAGRYADYSGNKTAGIPDIYYSGEIIFSPEDFYGIYFNVNLHGIGKYFVDDANAVEVPSYNIINTTIGIKDFKINGNISLDGWISVNNITNVKYAASAFVNPDVVSGIPYFLEPGLPANISVFLSFGFN